MEIHVAVLGALEELGVLGTRGTRGARVKSDMAPNTAISGPPNLAQVGRSVGVSVVVPFTYRS